MNAYRVAAHRVIRAAGGDPHAARIVDALADAGLLRGVEETCEMTYTSPFDFAQCETHDTTFPLGGTCKFNGRVIEDVLDDEADEQRARAVLAEHQAHQNVVETWHTLARLHPRGDDCDTCQVAWPCPTMRAAPEGFLDALRTGERAFLVRAHDRHGH